MEENVDRVLYARATYGEEEKQAVMKVLENPKSLAGGEQTKFFESEIAELFGKSHGIMTNSGSSANLLAFELLNLSEGSEIITPIVTFSTTVAPIVQKGLTPVFVDVGVGNYLLDIDQVEAAITDKTEAIMVPSLLGNVPDYKRLREIADEHDLYLIEDSCDTLGATINNVPTGKYTDISTTSFYGSHVITAFGGGGMICVHEDEHMKRLRMLRGWGRRSAVDETEDIEQRYRTKLGDVEYDAKFLFDEIGYNFIPLEASAAFGREQLKKLDKFSETRRNNFNELRAFFENYEEWFVLPEQRDDVETVWLGFPITVTDNAPFTRNELAKYLEKNNVQTRTLFSGNILRHPAFEDITHRTVQEEYLGAEKIMRSSLVLGAHQGLTEARMKYLKNTITSFLEQQ